MTPTRRAAAARVAAAVMLSFSLGAAPAAHAQAATAEALVPPTATIKGVAHVRGKTIAYRADAGEQVMRNAACEPRATIFSVSYLADGAAAARRPVTFLFNGGPGGATIALREGLAPVITANAQTADGFTFVDNPDSILDVTDLVFVDAPGTGYGRFFGEGASAEYWGVEEDAGAIAQFISDWLVQHGRTASPKYLIGESYAGTRVGFVSDILAKRAKDPIRFAGVVLVSPTTSAGGPRGMADDGASLSSQAAVAWFHGRGAHQKDSVEQVAEAARLFAAGPYAKALATGASLPAAEKAQIAATVSGFTGLPEAIVLKADLKSPTNAFVLELLADKAERTGLSDGRTHALRAITDQRQPPYNDPSTSPYTLTYDQTKAVEALFRTQMGYRPKSDYVRLSIEANSKWNGKVARGPTLIPAMFKDLMAQDPNLRITMVMGYFDLTVPYARPLNDYLAADLPKDRFDYQLYRTGHAVFSDAAGRPQATDHLREFYGKAAK